MPINLINDAWIPARTRSGAIRKICPAEAADPEFAMLAMPRSDLNCALTEFLIALLTTAAAPANEEAWTLWWQSPPTPQQLNALLASHAHAFDLSAFMQVPLECKAESIEGLLIDAPGEQTKDKNADFLSRAGTVAALSPSAAAASVIALQSYATQGGRGYATSIRGGGPLSTLVMSGSTLWGRLWPNVETREQIVERAVGGYSDAHDAIYPWLSQWHGGEVTPDGANPLLVYWSMPRRIQLMLSPGNGEACSITGERPDALVRECRIESGIKYAGWQHPLTPYWRRHSTDQWLPRRGRVDRIGYRDWLGLVQSTSDDLQMPARAVAHARAHRWQIHDARLAAYGYVTKSALVIGWGEGEMPLLQVSPDICQELERTAHSLVDTADLAADALGKAVHEAGGPRRATTYWEATEPHYWRALGDAVRLLETSDADDPVVPVREAWIVALRSAAYEAFDRACPLDLDHGGHLGRVVVARHGLAQTLRGYGKRGQALCGALGIAPPETAAVRTRKAR
jgi:CRISPR system Cascade subunit CasA